MMDYDGVALGGDSDSDRAWSHVNGELPQSEGDLQLSSTPLAAQAAA